jgi:hypothetical protein
LLLAPARAHSLALSVVFAADAGVRWTRAQRGLPDAGLVDAADALAFDLGWPRDLRVFFLEWMGAGGGAGGSPRSVGDGMRGVATAAADAAWATASSFLALLPRTWLDLLW